MPSMKQIMDDIEGFIESCRESMQNRNVAERLLIENSMQTARQIALWLDSCEYIRKAGKKKEQEQR